MKNDDLILCTWCEKWIGLHCNCNGINIYTDSAIEPTNPGGHLTWAFWAEGENDESKVIAEQWGTVGRGDGMTNNIGEYTAVLMALRWAYKEGHRLVRVCSDSQLVINQVTRLWSCNALELQKLLSHIRRAEQLMTIKWKWIPREANTRADELSRRPYLEEYA